MPNKLRNTNRYSRYGGSNYSGKIARMADHATRTNTFALIMLVVLAIALAGVAINAALFPKSSSSNSGSNSTYNWDYLAKESGRFYYTVGGRACSLTGVDVSQHQGYINWTAVKNDGISFAFIRVGARGMTEGTISQDSYFEYNARAASEAGIKVGAYF
jgi:GH25 family lysozyme M1 (1,4-beta-N-acetylmuramidase)